VAKIEIRKGVKLVVIDPFLNDLNEFGPFEIFTTDLSKFVFESIRYFNQNDVKVAYIIKNIIWPMETEDWFWLY
jgi:hypothetical protein